MGRQSKATKARHRNLGRVNNPQNLSVEDGSHDEDLNFEDNNLLESGFSFLDDESPSEEDYDSEDEEPDEDEPGRLIDEAKINHFNAILFEAQAMAVKAEREANGASEKPKRKRHYAGNSTRTRQYHAQKRRKIAATGQKFINTWFSKEKKPNLNSATELPLEDLGQETIEISDDSDASEGEESSGNDEIDASLHRLFPDIPPVSFQTRKLKKKTHQS